jgi:hypothetical protein
MHEKSKTDQPRQAKPPHERNGHGEPGCRRRCDAHKYEAGDTDLGEAPSEGGRAHRGAITVAPSIGSCRADLALGADTMSASSRTERHSKHKLQPLACAARGPFISKQIYD